jgi:negative regulator of sigma E activity
MTELDETTCEQLSAWMDGALSPEEARFLERRLQHDQALREKWERLQLASACLRGHEVRAMAPELPGRIAAALAAEKPGTVRRPWIGWAVAASVALAVIALVPRSGQQAPASTPLAAQTGGSPTTPGAATPGLADFLTEGPSATPTAGTDAPRETTTIASAPASPAAPLSPADFPLDPSAQPKSWPRSAAPGGADAALEGYLVRHSEMVGGDGLGGFVPYLDVVAAGEPESTTPEGEDAGQ